MTKETYKKEQWEEAMSFSTHSGLCAACGRRLRGGEFAHVIGQTILNKKYFGWWFVHNAENGRAVCSTALGHTCNGAIDIGYNLEGREAHIQRVIVRLREDKNVPAHIVTDPVTWKEYCIKC